MLKIAICDDDRIMQLRMQEYFMDFEKLFQVDVYKSGESLLASGEKYDFIFLDIDMKGISGIDTARILRRRDKKCKIIYVTGYDDFREYAFSVHAFAYLVKPVDKEKIQKVLREALAYTEEEKPEKKICFETETGLLEVDSRDIYYFEYQNRRLRMVTKAGDVWIRESISRMAQRMEGYGFLMPHKSFIVNLFHVRNSRGYDIYLTDGSVIPLSQKKSADFRRKLAAYLAEQI
ncbi:MAG: LytTR family DNA-binding domain-containing protein [Eubacteriales bacterium]|nr:LytTR family DNA-binding domain-containing protein [Eubacteriales bacterium]